MSIDLVVFRCWKDTGDVVALLPEIPADDLGRYCVSYEHLGQHTAADYHAVIQHSLPASPKEYSRLARGLTLIGYNLKPIRRATHWHHKRRQEEARRLRRQRDTPLSDERQQQQPD